LTPNYLKIGQTEWSDAFVTSFKKALFNFLRVRAPFEWPLGALFVQPDPSKIAIFHKKAAL
jgi:hypothetical protein